MRKIIFCFLLCGLLNCESKKKLEDCNSIGKEIKTEFEKGNNIFIVTKNGRYHDLEYYFAYKKYGIVNHRCFFSEFMSNCEVISVKKELKLRNIPVKTIINDMDSIAGIVDKKRVQFLSKKINSNDAFLRKYSDSILEYTGAFMTRPTLNDMTFSYFDEKLLDKILKIDSTFVQSSFWIVIDSNGHVMKIERYIKHSSDVDNLIIQSLKKSIWNPAILKKEKKAISVRLVYSLYNNQPAPRSTKCPHFAVNKKLYSKICY
jgi:hypothetical protein